MLDRPSHAQPNGPCFEQRHILHLKGAQDAEDKNATKTREIGRSTSPACPRFLAVSRLRLNTNQTNHQTIKATFPNPFYSY